MINYNTYTINELFKIYYNKSVKIKNNNGIYLFIIKI